MTNTLSKNWILKNGQKLQKAYSFSVVHKQDIKSEKDVLEILKVVDPENATTAYAKTFSKMLQLFDSMAKKTLSRRRKIN